MPIKVLTAKAHDRQLADKDVARELESVEEAVNRSALRFEGDQLVFLVIEGNYIHIERRMFVACLFVNKFNRPIKEIHCEVRLGIRSSGAKIAKATVDFDEEFMGTIAPDEALLVHLGFPVKGLSEDEKYANSRFDGAMDHVRVTFA